MNSKKNVPTTLTCRNCGAENPATAYCCLRCFKVMRPKEKIPFWKMSFRPSTSALAIFVVLAGLAIFGVKRWMENIEAQISMNFKSADYNLSLTADKKKRQAALGNIEEAEGGVAETPAEPVPAAVP